MTNFSCSVNNFLGWSIMKCMDKWRVKYIERFLFPGDCLEKKIPYCVKEDNYGYNFHASLAFYKLNNLISRKLCGLWIEAT